MSDIKNTMSDIIDHLWKFYPGHALNGGRPAKGGAQQRQRDG